MEEEFKRILNCILLSDKICDGEYYCICSDYIYDLKRAIEYYFEENKKIEKLDKKYFLDNKTFEQVDGDLSCLIVKINEIIEEMNNLKDNE